jgi:hypothetical protein
MTVYRVIHSLQNQEQNVPDELRIRTMIRIIIEDRILVLGMNGCGVVEVSPNSALGWRRMVSLTPTPRYKIGGSFPFIH